jgi:hypothetical protein
MFGRHAVCENLGKLIAAENSPSEGMEMTLNSIKFLFQTTGVNHYSFM